MQKPIFIAIVVTFIGLILVGNVPCNAQRPREHEFQLSYGPMARERAFQDWFDIYLSSFSDEQFPYLNFSGSYAVTYRFQARRRFAFGVMAGFNKGGNFKVFYSHSKGDYKQNNFMMAFETKFTYSDISGIQVYAISGLGGVLAREKNFLLFSNKKTYLWPTCQFTPFGVRYGKKLGGFAEIGYGYKGIVNLGLSCILE